MATGIIQANSGAKDKGVKAFVKGKTDGHRGTHQVIGQKIRFNLGYDFKVEEVAAAVENPYDEGMQGVTFQGASSLGSGSGSGSGSAIGVGPTPTDWVWWSDEGIWHRQINGLDAWKAPENKADSDWIYSNRKRNYFMKYADGTVVWH
ncbi:uncharacterized protein RSE6_14067 [Rhynchosporium secalis]|uniref:Uncharacterized protein n=1 Tax=Rhynchosporium secalis TaxID=38038 RepID=A0A1E1MUE1_RHYSE|nr:uncharacterized protein RSE6_14067 [Rhynchosporium secalis]